MERHDKRLTEHFCLDEFTYSGIAVDNAINNQPPPCACLALQNLAVGLLEPLRLLYGAPIAILSGGKSSCWRGRYQPTLERRSSRLLCCRWAGKTVGCVAMFRFSI
jgi:hypothetical protein